MILYTEDFLLLPWISYFFISGGNNYKQLLLYYFILLKVALSKNFGELKTKLPFQTQQKLLK
jgi:hypothetical protein